MFRVSAVCAVLLATGAAGAPVPREDQRPVVPLAGSVWEGDGVVARTTYEFHDTGRMSVTYNGTRYENNGTWQQNGKRVYWETNQRYCEFEGSLTGTTMTGRAWNEPGGKWTLTIKRKSAPRED